jgi:signal transduction histidine kinase
MKISDDGHGFPFKGVYDLATLNAGTIGPVSLKERIVSLRGDLILSSADSGSVLDISLPSRAQEVAK